jgi:signal transduction histidine kinase
MLVPLVARGQTLGLLSIVAADSGRRYTPHDLRFAEDLARRCAAAIDNARLFRQAREAIRVRDDVLAGVSHDLKSPLTSISGTAQLLQRRVEAAGGQRDERLATGLERIVATTGRMSALIDELVDTARLELGQDLPLRREVTDLVPLVEQAVADHQRDSDRHEIRLERRVARLVGLWDPIRLRRVLDNLLGNAVKYSPEGGPIHVAVDRAEDADGPSAVVTVEDRGVGIPPEDRAHIFERGRRGHNVGQIAGSGIGLAGACQIVRQHGGGIEAESVVGAGTTFTVRLPLTRGEG